MGGALSRLQHLLRFALGPRDFISKLTYVRIYPFDHDVNEIVET